MNLQGWLLEDDGAHLADSKRENKSLSLISDGTNDLGDHLLTMISLISNVMLRVFCTSGSITNNFYAFSYLTLMIFHTKYAIKIPDYLFMESIRKKIGPMYLLEATTANAIPVPRRTPATTSSG